MVARIDVAPMKVDSSYFLLQALPSRKTRPPGLSSEENFFSTRS